MTPALEQIKALPAIVAEMRACAADASRAIEATRMREARTPSPTDEHTRLMEDIAVGETRCLRLLAWADRIDTALQALRDEAGEADAIERAARYGWEHASWEWSAVKGGLDRFTRPTPAAEAAPQGGVQQVIDRMVGKVMAQREEILAAFVAKYGFQPDEAVQVVGADGSWRVIRREEMYAAPQGGELHTLLFDGPTVYDALTYEAKFRTGPENVSDTLDALNRAYRAASPRAGLPSDATIDSLETRDALRALCKTLRNELAALAAAPAQAGEGVGNG